MTNRSDVVNATSEAAGHDTNGGVTSWSLQTVSVGGTSSGWFGSTVELIDPSSITPVNTVNFYANGSFVSSISVNLSNLQANDLIVVYGGQTAATVGTLSVSDNGPNTYTPRIGPVTGDNSFGNARGWTAVNGNFTSLTVTLSDTVSPNDLSMSVLVFRSSNPGSGWTFDIARSGVGVDNAGGATRTTTAGIVASGDLVIAATQYVDRVGGAYTAGSGYTGIGTGLSGIFAEYKISAAGGTSETAPVVDATADHWIDMFISTLAPTASPSGAPSQLPVMGCCLALAKGPR
jgi:hypothetical protein